MKQIVQNLKTGQVDVADVPVPASQPGFVLVRTAASLISAGTERLTVEAGRKTLISRALEQPQLVKQVIDRARIQGVLSTVEGVEQTSDFRTGDRVACAWVGYASHAEILSVPKNLCVRIPDNVTFEA